MEDQYFHIVIKMANAAFEDDKRGEVARILRELADKIERSGDLNHVLCDINGNTVGHSSDGSFDL